MLKKTISSGIKVKKSNQKEVQKSSATEILSFKTHLHYQEFLKREYYNFLIESFEIMSIKFFLILWLDTLEAAVVSYVAPLSIMLK